MAPADPGGGWDGTARAMAASMEGAGLAKSTQVSNVPGAGGTIGLAQLANEKSEDYLMVMGLVMVGAIETNQSKATLDDVTPIARLTAEDEIIVVPAKSPYQTITDLTDDLAANGRKVAIAGGSAGGTDHIVAGLLTEAAGATPKDLNYIAYSGGGETLAALLGNKVSAGISGVSEYAEQVKAGKLRALAVTGPGARRGHRRPDPEGGRPRHRVHQLARSGRARRPLRRRHAASRGPGHQDARLQRVAGRTQDQRLGGHVHDR